MDNRTTVLSILLPIFILFISLRALDLRSDMVQEILNLIATIGSAIIGGYVAFYTSYLQIEGNKKLERQKELKLEKNICILLINDLNDIFNRLNTILEKDVDNEWTHGELKPFINTDALEKFKSDFIHLINEDKEVLLFSSVLNRLIILQNSADDKRIDHDKLPNLIKDITKAKDMFKIFLENTKTKMK